MPEGGEIAMNDKKGCKEEKEKYMDGIDDFNTSELMNIIGKAFDFP